VWAYWQEINISGKPGIVWTELIHIKLLYDWFSYWFVLSWMQLEDRDIICFLKAPAIDNVEHRKNKTWVDRRSEHIYVDFCILFFELGYWLSYASFVGFIPLFVCKSCMQELKGIIPSFVCVRWCLQDSDNLALVIFWIDVFL
jgi:hypothetical protein